MPRLKGTKNKKKRQVRLKLPPSTLALVTKLSEDSGLPILKVLDDAVLEGASELRTETYAGLIDFNLNRRGKIIRERELNKVSEGSETEQNGAPVVTGADQDGFDHASFGPGPETENTEDLGLDSGSQQQAGFEHRGALNLQQDANPFAVGDFSLPEEPEEPVG